MHLTQTMLYEDFQQAQSAAVEVTDRYRATPADDPRKDDLWREVVSRTDLSYRLLKRWLDEAEEPETPLSSLEPLLSGAGRGR